MLLSTAVYRIIQEALTNIYKHSGATHVSLRLQEYLDRIAIPIQPTHLSPELAGLTAHEREVLCLIVAGASNREIAEALYISERTVRNPITHILSQLNVRDRTQAAMFASPFLPLLKHLEN